MWDASSVNLQILYKFKTAKLFEKPRICPVWPTNNNNNNNTGGNNSGGPSNFAKQETDPNEDLFAIDSIHFVGETRSLVLAGACSQVMVFRFNKQDASTEIAVVPVAMNYDEIDNRNEPEPVLSGTSSYLHQAASGDTHEQSISMLWPLKVKTGHHKRLAGFQAELICISPWIDRRTPPYRILCMTLNVHANL